MRLSLVSTGYQPPGRSWWRKFRDAFSGLYAGVRCQSSFYVHIPAALAVIGLALALDLSRVECSILGLCIIGVLGAELMNSALERIAKAITGEFHEDIRVGLNIASSAVLILSLGAVVIAAIIFLPRLLALLATVS